MQEYFFLPLVRIVLYNSLLTSTYGGEKNRSLHHQQMGKDYIVIYTIEYQQRGRLDSGGIFGGIYAVYLR
jgi:hypothetical protein